MQWCLKGPLTTSSDMPSLYIPVAIMGKCKQINNSILRHVSAWHHLINYS